MGKQEMSDQYYERLKKCGCKISIDKNDVGTGWICADNLALTAGHLFGDIDEHSKITLVSCGVSSDAHIISRHHDDKHDYALLAIDKKFSTYMPILFEKPSDINSLSNVATYCFSSTVNHEMVNASGKINGETSETKYLKILSKEIGDNGNSGAPIYSLDKQAICGIQSLAASSKYSAESNTSLAFPTWEICDCDKEKIMAASVGELPQKAFELSEPFIKESSYKLLSVKSGKKFRAYTDALNSDEGLVKNISDLFLSCSRCMEYESVVKKHKADLGSATLLEWVSKRIEGRGTTGDGKHILNVVGTCGSGKTTFLGIEYFYLLNKFVTGKSLYVPFYFNIEDLLRRDELEFSNENVEPSTIQESILKYFDDFMEKSREVLGEYSHGKKINAVYILDGFDDGNFLSDDVYIDGDIFEHAQNISEKDDRIITAVNTYNYIQYSKKWDKHSGCVIYINEVNVIYDGIRARRFNRFIESYLALNKIRDERKISKVKDIIRKYKKSQISLNFMYKNYESISEMAANPSLGAEVIKYYRNIMKDDIERQFGKNYGNFINQAAYFWYFYGEKYDKLNELSDDNKISYATFCKIKSKPELCKYLISQYYVQEVINYKQLASSGVEIAQNSILRMFISRDISTMIRRELQNKPEAINALSIGLDKVPPQMKSMLIYIYARQDNTNSNAIIDKLLKEDTDSNEMLYYVERSKHLAEIFSARDLSACEKYLIMLIGDSKKRAFNRAFQLAYYGDRNHDFGLGLTNVDAFIDDIHAGLDFNNFFCAVSSKIHLSIASKKRYKLLEYDLFMLCDFIYSRLLQVKIDNPESDEKSFFYNKRYNSKTAKDAHEVLEESINLIHNYLEEKDALTDSDLREESILVVYFKEMEALFTEVKKYLDANPGEDIEKPLIYSAQIFQEVRGIIDIPILGWNINNKKGPISEKKRKAMLKEDDHKETYGQRILEASYIALLYLPENLEKEEYCRYSGTYDKNLIIRLIMTVEIGKTKTMDYTLYCEENRELAQEARDERTRICLMAMLNDMTDFGRLGETLRPVKSIYSTYDDINIALARDILLIQSECKFNRLEEQGALKFNEPRRADFINDFKEYTPLGRSIKKSLLAY